MATKAKYLSTLNRVVIARASASECRSVKLCAEIQCATTCKNDTELRIKKLKNEFLVPHIYIRERRVLA